MWGVDESDWPIPSGSASAPACAAPRLPTCRSAANRSLPYAGLYLTDALVAFDLPQWSFTLNLTNLADKQYYVPCRAFGDCFTGNGRNVTGTVTYRF